MPQAGTPRRGQYVATPLGCRSYAVVYGAHRTDTGVRVAALSPLGSQENHPFATRHCLDVARRLTGRGSFSLTTVRSRSCPNSTRVRPCFTFSRVAARN